MRNQWTTSWGMNGYIRLEFGTNACGITAFASYVSTNIYYSQAPLPAPTTKPVTAAPLKTPTKVPKASKTTSVSWEREWKQGNSKAVTAVSPVSVPTQRYNLKAYATSPSFVNYYTYLKQYIPPSLEVGNSPVQYYSYAVQNYYSPRPTKANSRFQYYGSPQPTLTHRPTNGAVGAFGYSDVATPKPSSPPLSYYGDLFKIRPPFPQGKNYTRDTISFFHSLLYCMISVPVLLVRYVHCVWIHAGESGDRRVGL